MDKSGLSKNDLEVKIRNSRVELLRIIAMLLIVFCHFATHGFELNELNSFSNKFCSTL